MTAGILPLMRIVETVHLGFHGTSSTQTLLTSRGRSAWGQVPYLKHRQLQPTKLARTRPQLLVWAAQRAAGLAWGQVLPMKRHQLPVWLSLENNMLDGCMTRKCATRGT